MMANTSKKESAKWKLECYGSILVMKMINRLKNKKRSTEQQYFCRWLNKTRKSRRFCQILNNLRLRQKKETLQKLVSVRSKLKLLELIKCTDSLKAISQSTLRNSLNRIS